MEEHWTAKTRTYTIYALTRKRKRDKLLYIGATSRGLQNRLKEHLRNNNVFPELLFAALQQYKTGWKIRGLKKVHGTMHDVRNAERTIKKYYREKKGVIVLNAIE